MRLLREKALPIIMSALREDMGTGDITSAALFEKDASVGANIIAKEECVLCGIDVARWVFNALDEKIGLRHFCKDGEVVKKGRKLASIQGSIKGILSGERVCLNFLSRLSGIATLTSKFVKKVKGSKAEIFDTRKTTPGLRELEKYAVRIGGGRNHRMGLWDQILIKDNHLLVSGVRCQVSRVKAIEDSVKKARGRGYKNIEIEIEDLKEFKAALDAGADIIMLDNMKIEDMKKAVRLRKTRNPIPQGYGASKKQETRVILEVSGGVTLENVRTIAKTGVDRISIGALTHSAPSIDFSLEICN